MRHILLRLSKGLMTKSGLEPSFLRVDLCCELKLGLVVCWEWLGREGLQSVPGRVIGWWSLVHRESKWKVCNMWRI